MKTKPILFSTQMVQAILDGRKTMTRRIIKSRHESGLFEVAKRKIDGVITGITSLDWDERPINDLTNDIKPKYQIGDILWVRETWNKSLRLNENFIYKATDDEPNSIYGEIKWKPSIYMPKAAARIFLKVTNVRVERLQDISEDDAKSEGIILGYCQQQNNSTELVTHKNYLTKMQELISAKKSFQTLWNSINGNESWDENPFVWVYEFERIEKPENF